jgi:hypothetical protein
VVCAAALGCAQRGGRGDRTAEELKASVNWLDPEAQEAGRSTIRPNDLLAFADKARAAVKPAVPFPKKSVLIVSGGGSYGAFPAGVLVGWTATGTRPEFDVSPASAPAR